MLEAVNVYQTTRRYISEDCSLIMVSFIEQVKPEELLVPGESDSGTFYISYEGNVERINKVFPTEDTEVQNN